MRSIWHGRRDWHGSQNLHRPLGEGTKPHSGFAAVLCAGGAPDTRYRKECGGVAGVSPAEGVAEDAVGG
jgi:hypothetical protein